MRSFALIVLTALLWTAADASAGGAAERRGVVKFKAGSELSRVVNRAAPGTHGPGSSPEHALAGEVGRACHPCPPTSDPGEPLGITVSEEDKHK